MIEDGEDPDEGPQYESPVLTQAAVARLLGLPVAPLRNGEQNHVTLEPSAQARLKLVDHEPKAVPRALGGSRAA